MSVATNKARADAVIKFISHLTVGEDSSAKFIVRPFQERFIRAVYEPADPITKKRKVRRAILSMAKKNGKTELAAALLLCHLIGPECEPNGAIYSAATERHQAAIVFEAAERMVNADPRLQALITVVKSQYIMYVQPSNHRGAGSKYKALSAEDGSKHGYKPSFVIYDELGEAPNSKLFDVLYKSMIARKEPLLLAISTQNHDPSHHFSQMIDYALLEEDPSIICHLYKADDDCDLLDESQWVKACPALGDFLDVEGFRVLAQEAARLPGKAADFRRYNLNQRVNNHSALIATEDWKAIAPTIPDPFTWSQPKSEQFAPASSLVLGLDMSARTDLTALVAISDDGLVKSDFWKPRDLLRQHSETDRFDYELHEKHGWLRSSPGRLINPELIAARIKELCETYNVRALVYDRAYTGELLRLLANAGVTTVENDGVGLETVDWQQGFISMGQAVNATEGAIIGKTIRHDGNPVLTFCTLNAITVSDDAGNRKFTKGKSRMRIDGAVAMAMALGYRAEHVAEVPYVSPFEDPDFKLTTF